MSYLNITCGLALISYEKSILKVMGVGLTVISFDADAYCCQQRFGSFGLFNGQRLFEGPQHCLQDHFRILRSAVLGNLHV